MPAREPTSPGPRRGRDARRGLSTAATLSLRRRRDPPPRNLDPPPPRKGEYPRRYTSFQRTRGATERLLRLTDRQTRTPDGLESLPTSARGLAVELEGVAFAYPSREISALSDFNLHVKPGERVALRGRSGCGKSTILRLVSRLYDVDEGAVKVGGVDVRSLREYRGAIVGVVPQEPVLLTGTILENIRMGGDGDDAAAAAAAARKAGLAPLCETGAESKGLRRCCGYDVGVAATRPRGRSARQPRRRRAPSPRKGHVDHTG